MYGVIRQYKVDSSQVEEIVRRIGEGFVPLITSAAGFVSYFVVDTGTSGFFTTGIFEDQAMAEESVKMAATWVKDNLAKQLPDPPQITSGQITLRQVIEDAGFGFCVMRRYSNVDSSHTEAITRLVRDGLLPMISTMAGFAGYVLLETGNGVLVSLSAFADQSSCEASNRSSLEWVKQNLADLLPSSPEVITGEIKLRKSSSPVAKG